MNLYDQLQSLQIIPNAYSKWKDYREEVTMYLLEHSYGNRNIAIFGAGCCNDIDLKLLTTYFEKVYLIDKDEMSMKAALKQYGLEAYPGISLQVTDFVGLSDNDYRDYADTLIAEVRRRGMATNPAELADAALEALKMIKEKIRENELVFDQYDNGVAIGIHSQLITMLEWIWSVILQTISKDEMTVRQEIMHLNGLCTEKFNKALVAAVKYHMVIGCEESRVGREGTIQGAVQAMADIISREQKKELSVLDEKHLIWSFNEQETKVYRMKLQTIKNNL